MRKIIPSERKPESVLKAEFEEAWPYLLGSLLDAFSAALREIPNIDLAELPRMADYAQLGGATSLALGWDVSFADIYKRKRDHAAVQLLDSSPVIAALLRLLDPPGITNEKHEWSGTYQQLLNALNKPYDSLNRPPKAWPASPRGLSCIIKRFAPSLKVIGVNIEQDTEPKRDGYHVKIQRKDKKV
jgi:hypothetical protein